MKARSYKRLPERSARILPHTGQHVKTKIKTAKISCHPHPHHLHIAARIGGIEDLPPRIEADADAVAADPTLATLAEQQAAHLRARLAAVANLQEALAHLAMSDFRGVAALEVCGSPTLQRWEVIEPWCLIRPARRGPWLYNPTATPGAVNGEALDPARVIITEARAIDLPCMFLLCAKYHSTSGWDAFLDVFGNPSLFLELPPQTTPQMAQEYDAIVRQIIGEGRGTIPSGSKFQTVETGQNSADSFAARAEWCKKAIITLALGGTLTMMSESGTGTLAGSAHSDSLSRLITATARRISRAVDTQWAAPILRTAFPGKPILAHFTLRAEEERDTAAAASLLATLAGAGYTVTEAQAEELLGFPVTYHAPAAPQPFSNSDPEPPTDPTDPAPLTNTTDPAPTPAEAEADAPLTEAELTALRSLSSAPLSPASLTPALSSALTSALTNRTNPQQDEEGQGDDDPDPDDPDDPDTDPEPPTDPEDNPDGTPAPTPDTPTTEHTTATEEAPTIENGPCRADNPNTCSRHGDRRGILRKAQKGGRSSEGAPRESQDPNKLPADAPKNQIFKVAFKSVRDALAGKGNQAFSVGKTTYTISQRSANHFGKHIGQKIDADKIAKALVYGKFEYDRGDLTAYYKGTKITLKRTAKNTYDIRTAYHETKYRVSNTKKYPRQERGSTDR